MTEQPPGDSRPPQGGGYPPPEPPQRGGYPPQPPPAIRRRNRRRVAVIRRNRRRVAAPAAATGAGWRFPPPQPPQGGGYPPPPPQSGGYPPPPGGYPPAGGPGYGGYHTEQPFDSAKASSGRGTVQQERRPVGHRNPGVRPDRSVIEGIFIGLVIALSPEPDYASYDSGLLVLLSCIHSERHPRECHPRLRAAGGRYVIQFPTPAACWTSPTGKK